MLAADLAKQMERDEKHYDSEISSAITTRLNDAKTKKAADAIMKTSGGWPYPPTKDLLNLYHKVAKDAWASTKSGYSFLKVDIEVQTNRDGTPCASATTVHRGEFRGGKSTMLKPGESVASLAKAEYGHELFAHDVWVHNSKVLGGSCKQVPAGFGIELPQIWVPEWKNAPKASFPPGASTSAVKILKPAVEFDLEKSKSTAFLFPAGPVIVEVTFIVSGSFLVQEKGTIDASFNLRTYKASCKKALGPLSSELKADFKEGKSTGSLSLQLPKVPGVKGSATVTLKPGGKLSTTLVERKVTFTQGAFTCEGTLKIDAEIKVIPNPRPPKVPVNKPKPVRVNWKVVVPIIIVTGVVAVGVTVVTGGTGAPAAAKGTALVVGGLLVGAS